MIDSGIKECDVVKAERKDNRKDLLLVGMIGAMEGASYSKKERW